LSALDFVATHPRTVLIGLPGSGKSTFLEWLQLQTASAELPFLPGNQQAIPLLLRVRQLDPRALPRGGALIERATGSSDQAVLMPREWIARQLAAGRVLFMLDGLDEVDIQVRDDLIIPWIRNICQEFPTCRYLISSRPVGYRQESLSDLKFAECRILDFDKPKISEYVQHWCTAVRLSQNEASDEARREGERDADTILAGFKDNPYIDNLARNPLMLSAVCLVNYFERGRLPEDRALLYKLCVEGLLHHWDQRRGIQSAFGLDEKLRACRELAVYCNVMIEPNMRLTELRTYLVIP